MLRASLAVCSAFELSVPGAPDLVRECCISGCAVVVADLDFSALRLVMF